MREWTVREAGGQCGAGVDWDDKGNLGGGRAGNWDNEGISGVAGQETEDQFAGGLPRNQLWAQGFYRKAGPGSPGRWKPIRY